MPSKTKKATGPVSSSQDDVSMTDAPSLAPEELLPVLEEQRIRIVRPPDLDFLARPLITWEPRLTFARDYLVAGIV